MDAHAMNARVLPISALLVLLSLPLWLAACTSSKRQNQDGPTMADVPSAADGHIPSEDAFNAGGADGPFVPADMPPTAVDTPPPSFDGPAVDGSVLDVGSTLDGQYTSSPDGRRFLLVDYCLPILPVPADGGRECPATVDDAIAATRVDGGSPGVPSPALHRCTEKVLVYLPYGPYAGGGAVCYYDESSRALIAIIVGWDTPTVCDQTDTAAFIYKVYGQLMTCTESTPIAVDAGSGQ